MSLEYFNDVTIPGTWAPLVAATQQNSGSGVEPNNAIVSLGNVGLRFKGVIQALNTNSGTVQIRGALLQGVSSNLIAGQWIQIEYPVNLSQIQVQGLGGDTTQVLQLQGTVE